MPRFDDRLPERRIATPFGEMGDALVQEVADRRGWEMTATDCQLAEHNAEPMLVENENKTVVVWPPFEPLRPGCRVVSGQKQHGPEAYGTTPIDPFGPHRTGRRFLMDGELVHETVDDSKDLQQPTGMKDLAVDRWGESSNTKGL